MQNILVVVDMQNDFIGGALGTSEAKEIVPRVVSIVKSFDGKIIFTKDTHNNAYLSTQEGRNLPVPHCIRGTQGWEICNELLPYASEIIEKPTFGSVSLAELLKQENEKNSILKITLVGLCTDICVISNAMLLKATLPEVEIEVISSACAGVSVKSHENALEAMKMCQIKII
ncbi:MAG: cysteine hydrolase [Clostridia bacterium]|nr:cysteine hydrolase [Clostridia bacterium]MBP3495629.1 cysteine hydrolase [Clostridia bacterium]